MYPHYIPTISPLILYRFPGGFILLIHSREASGSPSLVCLKLGISMGFLWDLPWDLASGLICYIAIENGQRNSEFSHWEW